MTLQNGNMNVRYYLLELLAFLMFLNRTSGPIAHLTRHSRQHIRRQLRQNLKDINTHKMPQMVTQGLWRQCLYTEAACKQEHFMRAGLCLTACVLDIKMLKVLLIFIYKLLYFCFRSSSIQLLFSLDFFFSYGREITVEHVH